MCNLPANIFRKISAICVGRTGRAVDKLQRMKKTAGCFTCSLRCRAAFVLEGLQSPLAQALQLEPELSANIYTRPRPYWQTPYAGSKVSKKNTALEKQAPGFWSKTKHTWGKSSSVHSRLLNWNRVYYLLCINDILKEFSLQYFIMDSFAKIIRLNHPYVHKKKYLFCILYQYNHTLLKTQFTCVLPQSVQSVLFIEFLHGFIYKYIIKLNLSMAPYFRSKK